MKVYLVAYHSQPPAVCQGSGRYLEVEKAIRENEWPYDNGDDPSFFAARREGGRLTWGVCRPDVRNAIEPESVCVFFAYTRVASETRYRLSAVATVAHRLDRRDIFQDAAFEKAQYINLLIRPQGNGWIYDESDRPESDRHRDWLWRIAKKTTRNKAVFDVQHKINYDSGLFDDGDIEVGKNYIVFSDDADQTYISQDPPHVATAQPGDDHETWCSEAFRDLTLAKAVERNPQGRDYLRTGAAGYPHRQLVFDMPDREGAEWRRSLIAALAAQDA